MKSQTQALLRSNLKEWAASREIDGRQHAPKRQSGRIEKQGAELKCGCGPLNTLPALQPRPRTPLS